MTFVLGMALGTVALLAILWWPVLRELYDIVVHGIPERVERHEWMRAMDVLRDPEARQ